MKTGLWYVVVVVSAIVGFLTGYSVSSATGVRNIDKARAVEVEKAEASHAQAPPPAQAPDAGAAAGGYGAAAGGYGAAAGGYGAKAGGYGGTKAAAAASQPARTKAATAAPKKAAAPKAASGAPSPSQPAGPTAGY